MIYFDILAAIPFPDWISETAIPLPGPLSIKWYGLSYIVGIVLAYFYARNICQNRALWIPVGMTRGKDTIPSKTMLEDFAFFCLLGIIIGGRLGSVLLYDLPKYIENPLDILKVWEGGMAFHGGFLGVCIAVWYASRKFKVSLWRWADIVAVGAPIGLFLVRLANFANQELWGRPTNVPWAIIFEKDHQSLPRHPSQLYEAFLEGIVLFFILWLVARKTKALTRPGICAGVFMFFYGCFRIFVEFFREPDAIAQIHPFVTRGMIYSLPMVVIGLTIVFWAKRRQPVSPRFAADKPLPEKGKSGKGKAG